MADVKSQDAYLCIVSALLMDIGALRDVDLARDAAVIERRTKTEGLSFLTKTLPSYYKHVLRCVEQGAFTPIPGFKHGRRGPLPKFLRGLVLYLFDEDGSLLLNRLSPVLGDIGQICTFLYKCEFPYTPEQEAKRLREFLEVEKELPETLGRLSDEAETVLRNAIELGVRLFRDFTLTEGPKHGPGAVAGRERDGEKYEFKFSERIDELFPWNDWFGLNRAMPPWETHLPNQEGDLLRPPDWWYDEVDTEIIDGALMPDGSIPPARGLFVNKDSRGPRYISAEPKELMWLQQAVGRSIAKHLETHELTKKHVNFTDQTINGRLALASSESGEFATIDLKDASDRVSLAVVRLLFPSNLVRLLEACRSNSAVLPGGTTVELKKFAPMGSACCFPIESAVFFLLSVACVQMLTGMEAEKASRYVYVYGDDIIVATRFAKPLMSILPEFFLAVNCEKSYTDGPFRESCGVDAIDGYDVTPVKLRRAVPKSKADVSSLISWVDTSNQLFYAGLWKAADTMLSFCRDFTAVPYVPYQSGLFGCTGLQSAIQISGKPMKWSKRYHALSLKVRRVIPTDIADWSQDPQQRTSACLLHTLTRSEDPERLDFLMGRQEASTMTTQCGSFLRLLHNQLVLS